MALSMGWKVFDEFMVVAETMNNDVLLNLARKWAEGVEYLPNIPANIEKYLQTGDESLKRNWPGRSPAYIACWVAQSRCGHEAYEKWGCRSERALEREHWEEVWSFLMEELLVCQQ